MDPVRVRDSAKLYALIYYNLRQFSCDTMLMRSAVTTAAKTRSDRSRG